jgi:hypothetical protein
MLVQKARDFFIDFVLIDLRQAKETLVQQLTDISKARREVRNDESLRAELSTLENTLMVKQEELVGPSVALTEN